MGDIRKMFDPKTIAFFCDSRTGGTAEQVLFSNILSSNNHKTFCINTSGDIYPPGKQARKNLRVTPGLQTRKGDGVECYSDILNVPEKVDLAVVATLADAVPRIVEDCGRSGVEGVVIASSGFRNAGQDGKDLENEILSIGRKYGVRILGPDRGIMVRPATGLNISGFDVRPAPGKIAFISQSASLGGVLMDWAATTRIGFSTVVSLGSMIDIDFGDLIDFLGEDRHTRSVMLYMDKVGNPRKFMSAARGFARNKPIVVVKPNESQEGAKAWLAHAGSMAGNDAAYDAAFRRAGVVRVKEMLDLFSAAEVLHSKNLPEGPRLAIITNAGAVGVMASGILIRLGGSLARLTEKSVDEIGTLLPHHWSKSNPIDLLGSADPDLYRRAIGACLDDLEVDGLMIIHASGIKGKPKELAKTIAGAATQANKPVIVCWMGREGAAILKEEGVPTYRTPEEAVKTYIYMYRYKRNLELLYETPAELPVDQSPPRNNLKAFVRRTVKEGRTVLSEAESKNFLKTYGIPTTTPFIASDAESAASWAKRSGYPVVLKVVSPDILHRSDVGGVGMVHSESQFRSEYEGLQNRVRELAAGSALNGITVEKMIENVDYWLILGAKKNTDFGSMIFFGIGGKGTEVFRDVSFAIPPLNQTLARLLMEETEVYGMLKGFQAKRPADLREIEQIIVSFSNLIVDFPEIAEIDLNPIVVSKGRAFAVNARIVLEERQPDQAVQYPHVVITPYPTRYVTQWHLPNGKEVVLRPIKPEDEPLEHELLTSLSEASMRTRFFAIIKDIPHEMLVRYCNIDYDREMAMVAEVREDERRKLIGIGRLIIDREFRSGEFAVLVHDDYHGRGLGYKLVDVLIGVAEEKGLDRIYGDVLLENKTMIDLCKKLGFAVEPGDDDEMVRVNLHLR